MSQSSISIHTLRVEGDRVTRRQNRLFVEFQSTPSAWRVTHALLPAQSLLNISIHTLRVEGDHTGVPAIHGQRISIHTLRVEGDH